jgi:hypothetical protein
MLALSGRKESAAYMLAAWRVLTSLPRNIAKRRRVYMLRRVPDRVFLQKGFIQRNLFGAITMSRALLIRALKTKK